jgi:hypothetical protein
LDYIPTETQIECCREVIRQTFSTHEFPEISEYQSNHSFHVLQFLNI